MKWVYGSLAFAVACLFSGCGVDRFEETKKSLETQAAAAGAKTDTGAILVRRCLIALADYGVSKKPTVTAILSKTARGWLLTVQRFSERPEATEVAFSLDGTKWETFPISVEDQALNRAEAKTYVQYGCQVELQGSLADQLSALLRDRKEVPELPWHVQVLHNGTVLANGVARGLFRERSAALP